MFSKVLLPILALMPIAAVGMDPAAAHPASSQFTIVLNVLTTKSGSVTVQAHTRIGATCTASFLSDGGTAPIPVGAAQHVGPTGIVRWQFDPHVAAGTIAIACVAKGQIVVNQARVQGAVASSHVSSGAGTTVPGTSPDAPGIEVSGYYLSTDDNDGQYYGDKLGSYADWYVTITNKSSRPFAYSKNMFLLIGDADHDQYRVNYGDHQGLLDRTLPPGQSISDDIWFLVYPSKHQEYLNLYWQPRPTSKPAEVFN